MVVSGGAGCSLLRPAVRPPLDREEIVSVLHERAEQFQTLVDADIALVMTVSREGGEHRGPTLGGHIAFDAGIPALWMRAEKIGREIFSLKAVGAWFWLALPETREVVTGGPPAYGKLPHLIRPGEVRRMLEGPDGLGLTWSSTTMTVEQGDYRFDVRALDRPYVEVLVDRREVAVTTIRRYDVLGRTVTEVRLNDYSPVGGILFPHRFVVDRPLHGTTVELRLGDPTLNKPIPAQAFQPAQRPGWRQVDLDRQPLSAVEAFRGE
jgi:hypothetical protein